MAKDGELRERLAALEQRVAALEEPPRTSATEAVDADTFWALTELKARLPQRGGVMFTGSVELESGPADWQYGATTDQLLDQDWSEHATGLAALGHPVRLSILRAVVNGVRTVAELTEQLDVGTSGQVYHHVRELTGARWLTARSRGQYVVPTDRVVPLLVILTATGGPS